MRNHGKMANLTIAIVTILTIILTVIGCSSTPAATTATTTTAAAAKTTAAAPATTAAAPATTAAAPAAATTAASAAATSQTAAAQPQGELVIGIPDSIAPVLDPNMLSNAAKDYSSLIFDNLVGMTPDEKDIAPTGVAEKYESSPDLKTWTFYLRKNVTFSNGDKLTADDVKFSLQRLMAPDAKATQAQTFRDIVQDIQIVDPYTIKIVLKAPSLSFTTDLSIMNGNGEGKIAPKGFIEKNGEEAFRRNPIGSGPYKIAKVDPGQSIQLEGRTDYWGGAPKYKTVTFKSIPEPTTAVAALKTGQVDVIAVSPDFVQQVKDAGLQIFAKEESQEIAVILHDTGNPQYPQSNLKVRQALSMAVNRDEIVKSIYLGYAKAVTSGYPQHTASYGFQPVKPPVYDVQKAKQLLAEAGFANGFSVDLYSYVLGGVTNGPLMVQAVAGYWDKIGVKAKIQPIDYMAFRNDKWLGKKTNGALSGILPAAGNRTFPTSNYQTILASTGVMTALSDPTMDQLIKDLATTTTLDAYKAANAKISRYLDENQINIGIAFTTDLWAASKKVTDWKLGPAALSMNTRYLTMNK